MSGDRGAAPEGRRTPPAFALRDTPNAERYVLEADAMRRQQLRTALLHGSRRTWREHRRTWPAVVAGAIVVGVIVAGLAVMQAIQQGQRNDAREQRQQQEQQTQPSSSPAPPAPSRHPRDQRRSRHVGPSSWGRPAGPGGAAPHLVVSAHNGPGIVYSQRASSGDRSLLG